MNRMDVPNMVIVEELADARMAEYLAQVEAAQRRAELEAFKAEVVRRAYEGGLLDPKEKVHTLKTKEETLLQQNGSYQRRLEAIKQAELEAAKAEIERKRLEDELSLTRAWLYAQSSIGGA